MPGGSSGCYRPFLFNPPPATMPLPLKVPPPSPMSLDDDLELLNDVVAPTLTPCPPDLATDALFVFERTGFGALETTGLG